MNMVGIVETGGPELNGVVCHTRRYNYCHGSQFADVVKVLRPFMVTPDVGIEIDILGEKLFLYAFTLSHNDLQ
jgi:hypothetical protein